jgi:L-amino acid N-acyltransferase YncA
MPAVTAVLIRPVVPADLTVVTAIYADAVLTNTATFEVEPPDETAMHGRIDTITSGGYPFLVAERGRRVVGYAYASVYRPRIGYRHSVEDSLYIAPEARGQGIGRALLDRLVTDCEQAGFRQMIAVIGDSGNLASIRVHAAAGFEPAGNLKNVGYKFGRWLDTVFMQRPLGPGAAAPPNR